MDFNFLFLTQGYNFRNTELHAVLGIEQLKHLNKYISIRNENHKKYLEIISHIESRLHIVDNKGISSFCLPFIFKNRTDKEKLLYSFLNNNIETRPIISGNLLKQPCFNRFGNYFDYPTAQIIDENGFYIGNNQFVNNVRLNILNNIIHEIF
jgi:CDP-4-dehydro-6-deoxyglucose reductase, E1